MPGDTLDVFISYSHEDKTVRQELEEQLVRLRREGLVGTWHERQITAGEEWRGWIDRDLISSDLLLLVVSEPFLASAYCWGAEIKNALKRRASGHAEVLPIIARPCDWRATPFAGLPTWPRGVGPLTEWHSRDNAWKNVVEGIREVATRLTAAREAVPLTRLESTADDRRAEPSVPDEKRRRSAASERASEPRTPRLAILGGLAAALAALAAVFFLVWKPQPSRPRTSPALAAEAEPLRDQPGRDSPAAGGPQPVAAPAVEQPSTPPPPAPTLPEAEPDAAGTTPEPRRSPLAVRADPEERPLGEVSPPETETTSEEPATVAVKTAAEPGEPADVAAEEEALPPEPAVEPPKPKEFERSLGILAAPGAEAEGECVAVLIADAYALTSRACAQASDVVVMGGTALTATRDEIFDLEPWQSTQTTDVHIIKLIEGLGETYGFVSTQVEESFEYDSLNAYFVESSAIRRVECGAEAHLAEMDTSGQAYVENAALDRYIRFVEEAADEAISMVGSLWATLLPEVLGSSEVTLAGFGCPMANRPPRNLVFSAGGSVVGIGYSCDPFDRLEPEVRDTLPPEILRLDLDCIASLGEIREALSDLQRKVSAAAG